MKCKECNQDDVIMVYKTNNVAFKCKDGHKWTEDYVENGGPHKRPDSYEIKLEDVLFQNEKKLYYDVLAEIQKNQDFFTDSSPKEVTSYLIKDCKFNKDELYKLFKKVSLCNNKFL